jgi:LAS superfamily LD-carboxypeptidase LdcB
MGVLDTLDPSGRDAARWFVNQLQQAGFRPTVTSARRSRRTQEKLYRDFIAGRSKFPAAKPGTSRHEFGRAFDVFFPSYKGLSKAQLTKALEPVGKYWEEIGGRWGGRFNDPIHFEW